MRENALVTHLHQRFLDCPQYARLLARTARAYEGELNIAGLADSAKSLILSVLLHEVKRPFFVIVADNHLAARFHQELSNLSRFPVFLFPSSEVSPYEQVLSSPDNIASQMEVLQHILYGPNEPYFVIVPIRALMQRVLGKETLQANNITLKVGDSIDQHTLAQRLTRLGYARESLVTLRGEFSIRGDIIDLFPSCGSPVRIELFGDEIESIRVFNIDNQRSVEETSSVLIGPRWWVILSDDPCDRQRLLDKLGEVTENRISELSDVEAETLRSVMEGDLIGLEAGKYPESAEYYAFYVHDDFSTLLDYVPQSSLLFFDEWDTLSAALKSYEEKLQHSFEEGLTTGRLLPLPRPLHYSVSEILNSLEGHREKWKSSEARRGGSRGNDEGSCWSGSSETSCRAERVDSGGRESTQETGSRVSKRGEEPCVASEVDARRLQGTQQPERLQKVYLSSLPLAIDSTNGSPLVHFDCHPVERFGNKLELLVERIRQWKKDGYKILISTEQPQRILGVLREWDLASTYLSDSNDEKSIEDGASGTHPGTNLGDLLSGALRLSGSIATTDSVWVTRYGFGGGFRLDDIKLVSVTDAEMFGLKRKPTVYRRPLTERSYERFTSVADLKVGDYVVHIKHGIGQFVGQQRITVDSQQREYLTIQYLGEDRLYVPVDQINLLSRYRGQGDNPPRLSRLGGAEWESTKRKVKRSVKQIAEDLVNLYAMRAKQEGFSSLADTAWQYEMEEAFPYEETPDQWQAIVDTKKDLESTKPMDRLICGDVGFGKTEVAIRGIFKTVMSGKQAAVLVPTTILAQQHFNTMSERFAPYPIRVGLLSRFRTAKEQREIIRRLTTGECDVVIGTHRMLQKDITFKDLGLIVIDEEQRFGVAHKEKLKQLRVIVDVLTMSATPIPRTLHMALSGARDMSLINTPPINRAPIKTFVGEYKLPLVRTAILHEMERGGQVYFVHNRVESIESVAFELKQLVPEARIAIGHGQMAEHQLENVMLDFLAHECDILVCTTIIESGLDIPNVNTIVINDADKLGLAQLYQLRGRVGRSDVQAYAYCLFHQNKVLTETAQNRLKAIREFTSLGSGYQIALRDMEIRGVGNILGAEQHGHMISVGFDLYCKLLEESVAELKGESVEADADTQVDINVTAFLPETYIEDNEQRLIEYKRLADVKSERLLNMLVEEWRDRFGPLPTEAQQLVSIVKLRLLASKARVTQIKPDPQVGIQAIRLSVDFRLQQWLPVQARLPKHLAMRTTYKPGSAGGHGPTPYVLVRSQGITPSGQLELLEELLSGMVANQVTKA